MVMEPYRETTLTATREQQLSTTLRDQSQKTLFHWLLVRADDSGDALQNVEPEVDFVGGSKITVTLTHPGTMYSLVVKEFSIADDGVTLEKIDVEKIKVSCKYVRREIRDLTDTDRTEFLDALQEFYTVSSDHGKVLYGATFSNYERVTAYHNVKVRGVTSSHVAK